MFNYIINVFIAVILLIQFEFNWGWYLLLGIMTASYYWSQPEIPEVNLHIKLNEINENLDKINTSLNQVFNNKFE